MPVESTAVAKKGNANTSVVRRWADLPDLPVLIWTCWGINPLRIDWRLKPGRLEKNSMSLPVLCQRVTAQYNLNTPVVLKLRLVELGFVKHHTKNAAPWRLALVPAPKKRAGCQKQPSFTALAS
jgi:hypothetical protein